jgi:hypothetical protein
VALGSSANEVTGAFDVLSNGAIVAVAEVLGPWAPGQVVGAADVSFSAADMTQDQPLEEPVWRVRLSRDRTLAVQGVTSATTHAESTRDAVMRAERLLTRPVSLATLPPTAEDTGRCQAFLDGASALLSPRARVQTYVETRLIGWTVLPLVGEVHTVVDTRIDAQAVQLHMRAVDLTILSRTTLMRLVLLIARSAARWTAAMATPLAPAAGVVAAWKTIDDIMREERWFRNQLQAARSRTLTS